MKYTAQAMLKELRNNHPKVLSLLKVDAKDKKYQVWERNLLSVALYSSNVFMQKLEYIHLNPLRTGMVAFPDASGILLLHFTMRAGVSGISCRITMAD